MPANISTAKFKSTPSSGTSGTAGRTLGQWWGDVINVIDFGADRTGTVDSASAIQAAFDAAFGTSGSPHGSAASTSNRPVYFPAGNYKVGTTLNVTRVVGGLIYGASQEATQLTKTGSLTKMFNINGAAHLRIENFTIQMSSVASGIGIDLDWDGTAGGDGLHSNTFSSLLIHSATSHGIRIANSDNDGANNLFYMVTLFACGTGIEAVGADAINQTTYLGGAASCNAGYVAPASGGSFGVLMGMANADQDTYDVLIDNDYPCAIIGGRSESSLVSMSTGLVTIRGFMLLPPPGSWDIANITGGKCTIDGCRLGDNVFINGSGGTLYGRGNLCSETGTPPGSYSGTVSQWLV